MGILNVTPDSFYDGGRYFMAAESDMPRLLERVRQMLEQGMDILDVGGESTRPGAPSVELAEEIRRSVPLIRAVKREFPNLRVSIDSRKPEVAMAALDVGADMLNDVGGLAEPEMRALLKFYPCEAVMMHMQGTPQTMQLAPTYDDVVRQVRDFFTQRLQLLQQEGVDLKRIIVDPGIGFGKTLQHNLLLLQNLRTFTAGGQRLLIGASRKSFIGKLLDLPESERLESSLAAAVVAYMHGATIVRTHDGRAVHVSHHRRR